jgi:hypothetical protein
MPPRTKRAPARPTRQPATTAKGSSADREPRTAAGKRAARLEPGSSQTDPAVIAFLRELDHPLKQEIEAVRQLILDVSPEIREGIKWNAPSFRTTEFFATFNLRARDRVRLVLHLGAKVKETPAKGLRIADPAGLLEWLAEDRCLVTLGDGKDVQAKGPALQAILREWIASLPG